MKTSNRILLAAVLIVIAYAVGYDFALKAEYNRGAYKDRFYRMTELKVNAFDSISNNFSNIAGIRVEQGAKYGVWVNEHLKDVIKIDQQGKTINISRDTSKDVRVYGYRDGVVIICPSLKGLSAKTQALNHDDEEDINWGSITVAGFNQNTPLTINTSKYTETELVKNELAVLNVWVGAANKDRTRLTIDESNQIQSANLHLNGHSQLSLNNAAIANGNYQLGDSTMVTLSGKSLKLIKP